MNKISFNPIGLIHSEHKIAEKTPIQPVYAENCKGTIEIFPDFVEGLQGLEGFSHIYLIYNFNQAKGSKLKTKPFLDDKEYGIFATRAPNRPNTLGLSIVELIDLKENILYINGVDILDKTPLLDIKPYTAKFDLRQTTRNGWQDNINEETAQIRGLRNYKK